MLIDAAVTLTERSTTECLTEPSSSWGFLHLIRIDGVELTPLVDGANVAPPIGGNPVAKNGWLVGENDRLSALNGANLEFMLSLGRAASDAYPQRIATTWTQFVEWLYQFHLSRTPAGITPQEYQYLKGFPSKSPEGQRLHADKDGAYVVLADFGGHQRSLGNIIASYGVPLDIDVNITAEEVARTLAGFTYVAYTTYAHTPGNERWRVFVPVATPMPNGSHYATWEALNARFGNRADGSAKDPSRLSYLPGKTLYPTAAQFFHGAGALFQPVPAPDVPAVVQTRSEGPVPGWAGPADDETLLTIACAHRLRPDERMGAPIHFTMLWTANTDWLTRQFPSREGHQAWDYTLGDMALAGELSYWTGSDRERMIRLMQRSGLAQVRGFDSDWMERKVALAVDRAIANAKQWHFMEVPKSPVAEMVVTIGEPSGPVIPPPPESMEAASAQAALIMNAGALPGLNDYWAYLPDGDFIHRPSGEHHPATTVDLLIGKEARMALVPSRPVHRMTWAPGYPERFQVKDLDPTDFRAADCWLYNRYEPPQPHTNIGDVTKWLNLLQRLYPDDWQHIRNYCADSVQAPGRKCNHALVLGSGVHGIGKDTLLAPLRHAVGHRNFVIIKPSDLVDVTNPWVASRVVQVSESRDLGEGHNGISRYEMYERCKDLAAAPPATLLCNDKYIRKHQVLNVLRLIVTTNHAVDGLYIDPEDRRHYCAWSDAVKMTEEESMEIWEWYNNGGLDHVANYLSTFDLNAEGWNRGAPPARTAWWHQLVDNGRPAEDDRFKDAIDRIGKPEWITLAKVAESGGLELAGWMQQPGNKRKVEREMDRAGYRKFPNPQEARGRWYMEGQRVAVYRRADVTPRDLLAKFMGG